MLFWISPCALMDAYMSKMLNKRKLRTSAEGTVPSPDEAKAEIGAPRTVPCAFGDLFRIYELASLRSASLRPFPVRVRVRTGK